MHERTSKDTEQSGGLIGSVLGDRYQLESRIGSSSTGDLYRAKHLGLGKNVTLRILHPSHEGGSESIEEFKREAKAAARLDHPNVLRVSDFGEGPDGLLYLVMEYLDGRDLLSVMEEQWPFDDARVVDIMCQVLAALSVAHAVGVVHRDLKPDNILLQRRSQAGAGRDLVKVCDFGIAQFSPLKLLPATSAQDMPRSDVSGARAITGTPHYMSPEQARALPLDPRSDIYSAGVLLFQMLAGQLPFTAKTPMGVAVMHCWTPPPHPSWFRRVNEALEAVCLKAMSKSPDARYQSAREMQDALRQSIEAQAPSAAAVVSVPPVDLARRSEAASAERIPAIAAATSVEAITDSLTPSSRPAPSVGAPRSMGSSKARLALMTSGLLAAIVAFAISQRVPAREEFAQRTVATPSQPIAAAQALPTASVVRDQVAATNVNVQMLPSGKLAPWDLPVRQPVGSLPSSNHLRSAQSPRQTRSLKPKVQAGVPARASESLLASVSGPGASPDDDPSVAQQSNTFEAASSPRSSVEGPATDSSAIESKPARYEPARYESEARSSAPASGVATRREIRAEPASMLGIGALSADRATVTAGDIDTRAGVSKASLRDALKHTKVTLCYRNALRAQQVPPTVLTAKLRLATDMSGNVISAAIPGRELPSPLSQCVEHAARAARVRGVDTGGADATVVLTFAPGQTH